MAAIGAWDIARLAEARRETRHVDPAALMTQECIDAHLQGDVPPAAWQLVARACKELQRSAAPKAECVLGITDSQSSPEWLDKAQRRCHAGDWLSDAAG